MKDELNCKITQVVQVSPIMKIFRVSPLGWELPDFIPGQFVALFLPPTAERCDQATEQHKETAEGKMIKRAYSIASSSKTKEHIEFYITLVHSGALTPRLFNLNIGDKIGMGTKFVGMFTLKEIPADQNIVLIATGTGVAPYMSMLRTDAMQRTGKIAVIHGAANSWDLGYSSELTLLESISSNISYIPTITEPDKEPGIWNGEKRFIEPIWQDNVLEKKWGFRPKAENTHVFLCGNPMMTNSMTEIMKEEGFTEYSRKNPTGQIHVEKF